jgi:hypothetical protein
MLAAIGVYGVMAHTVAQRNQGRAHRRAAQRVIARASRVRRPAARSRTSVICFPTVEPPADAPDERVVS